MATPGEVLENLERAEAELESIVVKAADDTKQKIIDLLRIDQLYKQGIGPEGTIIGVYSKATESINRNNSGPGFPKKANSPYNFLDSGLMYQSYEIEIGNSGEKLYIINTAMTFELFLQSTSLNEDSVIGFTQENSEKINWEILLPRIREYIKDYI